MSSVLTTYLIAAGVVWVYMTLAFLVAVAGRRNDLADVAWGLGFVLLALGSVARTAAAPRTLLMAAVVTVWGVRLAVHVATRNRGKAEDFRYAQWRREWGRWFYVRTYLQVFMLQGLFMVLVASPLVVVASQGGGGTLGAWDALGAVVALTGIAVEAVADRQLSAFKSDPANRGALLESGLWSWSRHPNYFGDALTWTGVGLIGLAVAYGWIGLLGPVVMTLLLRFVSGVPMLERKHAGEPAFEAYRSRTNAFFPAPPRSR